MAGSTSGLHRFTVDEFERMSDVGVLPERGVELVGGLVVEMSARGDRQGHAVMVLAHAFVAHSRGRYFVNPANLTLRLGKHDAREPDIALARAGRSYARERPRPDELALIVEVADSSLAYDLGDKKAAYARAAIPEYWVVDLQHDAVVVHRSPNRFAETYLTEQRYGTGEVITPVEFLDAPIAVSRVLGLEE